MNWKPPRWKFDFNKKNKTCESKTYLVLHLGCLTVCVTRKWAGVDSAWEQKKTQSQKNASKPRRLPLVGCTLCWAFFTEGSMAKKRGLCLNNEIMAYYSIFDNHQKQRIKESKTGHVHALLRCSLNNVQPCVIRQKVHNRSISFFSY